MSYLKRLDLNIEPFLAYSWLDLAWKEQFDKDFSEGFSNLEIKAPGLTQEK